MYLKLYVPIKFESLVRILISYGSLLKSKVKGGFAIAVSNPEVMSTKS